MTPTVFNAGEKAVWAAALLLRDSAKVAAPRGGAAAAALALSQERAKERRIAMATTLKNDLGSPATRPTEDVGYWARGVNVALGVWLFISGFMWEQPQGARVN